MIRVERFKREHYSQMKETGATSWLSEGTSQAELIALENAPFSYTGFAGDKVVFCAGILEYWNGRGEAWVILATDCKPHFMEIHNVCKRFLEICSVNRIEATVDIDFKQGHRWCKALGFELEAKRMRSYYADGRDCSLYAFVRNSKTLRKVS